MDTNQLEKQLVDREIKFLNGEIVKGIQIISDAFKKYGVHDENSNYYGVDVTPEDLDQFHEYVNNIKIASRFYYSGYHFKLDYPTINENNPPKFLKNVLAKYAVREFIEKVNEIDDIRSSIQ